MSNGPARATRDEAQTLLIIEAVDLVDHAVDVVAEPRPFLLKPAIVREQLRRIGTRRHQRIGRQAPALIGRHHIRLALAGKFRRRAPGVSKKPQRPRCRDLGIELAQGACRRIARIGEDLAVRFQLSLIERCEIAVAHINFAAHIDQVWHASALKSVRDVLDRHDVGGDVFAFDAVSARCRFLEQTLLVADRNRQAIDLRLGGNLERIAVCELQEPAHAVSEIGDIFFGKGVRERQHRDCVAHLGKGRNRGGTNTVAWAI